MIAYHGKEEVKHAYLLRVTAHERADEVIKGKYWQDGMEILTSMSIFIVACALPILGLCWALAFIVAWWIA